MEKGYYHPSVTFVVETFCCTKLHDDERVTKLSTEYAQRS